MRQLLRAGLDAADVVVIDSLTAQKRLAQAGFGLALVPASSVRDELRRGLLVELDVPAMRTAIPIVVVHRRNGYLSPAARALLELLMAEARRPAARVQRNRRFPCDGFLLRAACKSVCSAIRSRCAP